MKTSQAVAACLPSSPTVDNNLFIRYLFVKPAAFLCVHFKPNHHSFHWFWTQMEGTWKHFVVLL